MTASFSAPFEVGHGRCAHRPGLVEWIAPLLRGVAAAVLGVAACGCDIEQGFRDTGRTLFPNSTTYIDAPGIVIARGSYRSLNLGRGTTPLIFARSQDRDDASLYVLEFSGGGSCSIPDVGRFRIWNGGPLTYFEGDLLRFANERCEVEQLTLSGVGHPLFNPTPYFIVPTAEASLLRVQPHEESVEEVATDVRAVFSPRAGEQLVWAGDELLFTADWKELEPIATGVIRIVDAMNGVYILETDRGIESVDARSAARGSPPAVLSIFEDACELAGSPGWVYFYRPCEERRTRALSAAPPRLIDFDVEVDPRYARVYLTQQGEHWQGFLRDVDAATNLGTLFAIDPDGDEHQIGENAALEATDVVSEDGTTWLLALVDVAGNLGRVVRYAAGDAEPEELATGVVRAAGLSSIVSDFDGAVGNYAVLTGASFDVVAEGVPPDRFVQTNEEHSLFSVFSNFDGSTGTLTLGPGPVFRGGREVAQGVPRFYHAFLDVGAGIPGVAYVTDFDFERGTGRLGYHNYELDLTAPIHDGVSDFLPGFGGIVYVVAEGEDAGIWWARAR